MNAAPAPSAHERSMLWSPTMRHSSTGTFNLAAMRGSVEAKVYRKELACEMASDEVAEAQRQAREWLTLA